MSDNYEPQLMHHPMMGHLLMGHLRYLCETIGPRPGGSPGNHQAAKYISQVLEAAGWSVEEQPFDCPQWTHHETILTIDGNRLTAAANAYSPPCDVTAPTAALSTIAELEEAELTGRIGILCGDLTRAPLSPKAWFLKSERDDHLITTLERKRPAAVITVQADTNGLERLFEDWEFLIPSATVPPDVGLTLLRRAGCPVSLRIDSDRSPGHTANVVARSKGGRNRVVLCAHYDTKIDTPGAYDNGSGVAVLLALAQAIDPVAYPFCLELVAFANEEYMPIGDEEYVRRNGNEFDDVIAAINVDGVGQYLGTDSIAIYSPSGTFESATRELTAAYAGLTWVDPWPESNHSTFVMRGVPSIALSSTGRVRVEHRPTDVVDWLSPSKLDRMVRFLIELLDMLADKSPTWSRK